MPGFTPDTARALGGRDWLVTRRVAAAERLATVKWPSASEEVWRYSRVDDFDLDRFEPRGPSQRSLDVPALDAGLTAKGVVVGDLRDVDDAEAADWLGVCSDASPDAFTLLHDAFVVGGAYVRVPAGVVVEKPLFFEHRSGGDGLASFPHTLVVVGEGAEVTVVDRFAADGAPHLCDIVIELNMEGAVG